ncbi:NAD-dependent epimerase/dehydratase family protein [Lichenifustis flavocetrariae]|uniref:NAD-dependent epimerase/dehydratase family protein n=1 Tax=Lichenifustis flavocetrariae TaxID=2949735 RepID=A0AA41Z2V3_9HYPH|nr:NAD-dependent epimerase/dehydratase family protein [Lichenifustis flavocetrariae]MCW6511962.1 NAD-dependent epimerase/dehydratase family protein [Lichenifustis flavocetrariae]
MSERIVVVGYGACGRATVEALIRRNRGTVAVAQRTRPTDLPQTIEFRPCDVLDPGAVQQALFGATQVVLSIGLPYDSRVWRTAWPRAMTNVVEACAATGARLVFIDNLYMMGPQREPLREDMALSDYGAKPAIRSEVTRIWMAAASAGRARITALRPPDFYGPGVGLSHLGTSTFGALAKGKPAFLIAPPDTPHDFAYVPDIGRAVVTLLEAPDDAFGRAWNMPCAPTRTPREILRLGAEALGVKLRIRTVPLSLLPVLGLVSPFLREVAEMRFTFDRPYEVDASQFKRRFWSDVTPFDIGAPATARSFPADAPSAQSVALA